MPPLAKLGFWRVILDESHVIKREKCHGQGRKDVRRTEGGACSTTPAPLSLENLQSQFKFLGCESVASDMSRFKHFLSRGLNHLRFSSCPNSPLERTKTHELI